VNYTITEGELYTFFINGEAKVYATAEEAAGGKAIRLGPPFRFDVRSSVRGDSALVNVGLKDGNGCTLRIASGRGQDGSRTDTLNIHLKFLAIGEERTSIEAQYG